MSRSTPTENHLKTGGEHLEFKNKLGSGTMDVAAVCGEVFQELKLRRKHRYIIFKIAEEEIEVEVIGKRSETFEDFKGVLPYTECRFGIYDHESKTLDGRQVSKLWFVSWLPNNSTPYHKMAYTSAKTKLRDTLPGVFDVQASTTEDLEIAFGFKKAADEDDENDEDFDF